MYMIAQVAATDWNIPGWASVIGILMVVVATVAAAVAVARVSYNETRIKGLLGDLADSDRRMGVMKEALTDLQSKYVAVSSELGHEKDKVAVLQNLVTGKEQLDHLQNSFDHVANQVLQDHKEIQSAQRGIMRKLDDILHKVEEDVA